MKNTGIIRKLDELGRIVIPKELRKRYKIEIGDFIDISTLNETIVLKKYDPLEAEAVNLKSITESIKQEYKCDIIVTGKDKIMISTNDEILNNQSISESLIKLMTNKEEIEILKNDNFKITDTFSTSNSLFIKKVSQNDEVYAYIIILTSSLITKSEKDLTNVLKRYILNNIVK